MSAIPLDASLAMPGVQTLHPYQPGKPIEALQREYGIEDIVKLASNENPLGPSPLAREAVQQSLDQLAMYPDCSGYALKEVLASKHGLSPDCITLGNGSNDILDLMARAFLGPGRAALFSQYAFIIYPLITQAVGAESIVAPAHDGSKGERYGHDLAAMLGCLHERVRVIFIANPNNPTGTWVAQEALHTFLQAVPSHVLVVLDEAYFEYVNTPGYPDSAEWLSEFPNLTVTRTFSKAYGLAGLRCGYALSNPAIADLLNRVRQPFNVNLPALAAAQATLADEAHLAATLETNQTGLQQLAEGFSRLGLRYIPSVANFICVALTKPGAEVYEQMLRAGVIVRPLGNYGLPMHVRVTTGTADQNERVLAILAEALKK